MTTLCNKPCKKSQNKGFSLPGAIFIMVALAAVGIAMVTLNSTTSVTSALNIEQTRALLTAQSAMEWSIKKVVENDDAFNADSCNGLGTLTSVEGYNINITCTGTCPDVSCCSDILQCNTSPRVTLISVIATRGNIGDTYYVKRQVQTTISYDGT